jgi:hypothetical protein
VENEESGMSHKHCKVTSYEKQHDGSIKVTTKSYYEELSHVLEEIEKPYTNLTALSAKEAVERALERITSKESPQVIITIKTDNRGREGIKVVEKYIVDKRNVT